MHRWGNKKDMAGDDPPYLSVGTEVSAKYKGAFCEAKIKKVVKSVKCKVQYKNEQGSVFVNDDQIKGLLMSGASVEVKQVEKKETIEGTIVKIQDLSQYTVVFDDGDIATLRRTALCLKSGRHFAESETLDQLPLTHPEHFSTPVVSGVRGSRRRDDITGSCRDENSDDEEKQAKVEREEDMGKVVSVEVGDKKKSKDNWFPGLIVAPNAQDSVKIDVEDEYLVRSFKDGRYYTVPKSETGEFTREMGFKIENPTLKQAVEKAILFLDKSELPPHWDRDQLFGMADFPSDIDASDTDSMDDEPREEKDHFVAQLYKFMDDRGTPINKGPTISTKDVDLYRLFKIVYKLGGYNRVTNRNQWKSVAMKSGYNVSQTNNVKSSYKKYLHSFEDFYRKLGCTLLSTSRDNKLRSRSNRPLIRDRDKAAPEKFLDKDDTSSSNNEDVCDVKEVAKEAADCVKGKPIDVQSKDDESVVHKSSEMKKENTTTKIKREQETEDKSDNNMTKDAGIVQLAINKDIKDEKLPLEKRAERKSVKPVTKPDEAGEKKMDRFSVKMKTKKTKPVEKRIKKTEGVVSQMKEKRTLKERMKAIVHKLKLSSTNSSGHQDKKKQKTAEELDKLISHGMRIKLKDDLNMNPKTRKLSVGSGDSKSSGSGQSNDKKFGGSSNSINSLTESTSSSSGPPSKLKKNDEDGSETSRKKSSTRKRREDDRFAHVSTKVALNEVVEFLPPYKSVCIGDKLKVYYEPTHETQVTYEAKVTNKRYGAVIEYLVHYTGWNTRYDEWIRRSRIADNLSWTPSRSKRKPNQHDNLPSSQTQTAPAEPSSQPNQNNVKPEKLKRSSMSPVAKSRSKLSIKSGMKQMKNIKNKLESKSKKNAPQKDSDTDSESEDENSKKQELQKTRSRTEKRKQQGEEPSPVVKESSKDTEVKKKTTPMKRTRSGSIKLESKETPKKRKLSPSILGKSNKTSTIRSSLMKTLGPRKRINNRTKDSKDEKEVSESSTATNDISDDEMEECNEFPVDAAKDSSSNDSEKNKDAEGVHNPANMYDNFVLKLKPVSLEKGVKEDIFEDALDTLESNEKEPVAASANTVNEKEAPILRKEAPVELEGSISRSVPTQLLPDSYLAENLDSKPKIVKAKLKKEADEKSGSPSKSIGRSSEKSTVKPSAGEIKEKTIFTSRSPSEKKNEKTPEKDIKIRSNTTFSSYLNIEKIDSIKKATVPEKVEKTEKPNIIPKPSDSSKVKCEDDIYEFKEPEPLVIDDRAILHRRSTPRFFEDTTFKRTKPVASTVDSIIKEVDEPSQLSEDMNIIETKSISQAQDDTRELTPKVSEQSATRGEKKNLETAESTASDHKEEVADHEEDKIEEDSLQCEMTLETAKSIVLSDEKALLVLTSEERLGDSDLEKSDDDADESKLVILETDSVGELEEDLSGKSSDEAISNMSLVIDSVATEKNCTDTQSTADEKKSVADAPSTKGSRLTAVGKVDSIEGAENVTKDSVSKKSVISGDEKPPHKFVAVSSECYEDKGSQNDVCDKVTKRSTTDSDQTKPKMKSTSKNVADRIHYDSSVIEDKEEVKPSQPSAKPESARDDFILRDNVIGEVVVEVSSASKKEKTLLESKTEKDSEVKREKTEVDECSKSKEEDSADNDGLLLCEETIPKSPEAKEVADTDGGFECASRGLVDESSKKLSRTDLAKTKKELKSATSNVSENSSPLTPDDSHSMPGMSPSEEVSGFSSTNFSLNEKLCGSNKDSSENETSSDTSEKHTKVKKYSNEAYMKKNASEFDNYLKRKAENNISSKLDDSEKKKTKSNSPSVNESDKDDSSDAGSSSKTAASPSPPKKSVVANILAEIPGNYDSNQRIEFLELKQQQLRNKYNSLKQEVASIDKKRKKLKRREREGRMMTRNEANSLL